MITHINRFPLFNNCFKKALSCQYSPSQWFNHLFRQTHPLRFPPPTFNIVSSCCFEPSNLEVNLANFEFNYQLFWWWRRVKFAGLDLLQRVFLSAGWYWPPLPSQDLVETQPKLWKLLLVETFLEKFKAATSLAASRPHTRA